MVQDQTVESASPDRSRVSPNRLYAICGLLLLASAINYMDRQTLSAVAKRITDEFQLSEQQYGNLEASFSWSFALGALTFGILADRLPVRWLYPGVLFLWSCVGFLTGYASNYSELLWCRGFLGFFEAAHWPCALKTTQALLDTKSRAMGNSVLQSGTSIGAIATPIFMLAILTLEPGSWRIGFQIVGAAGALWIIAWLLMVRQSDLHATTNRVIGTSTTFRELLGQLCSRKFAVILVVVAVINTTWQILRAWLPKILIQGRGYTEAEALQFNSLWFVATDVGCLLSGAIALRLAWRGWSIKSARVTTFGLCVACCLLLLFIPFLEKGWLLLGLLLVVGAGALGMFPLYYSFTQDISKQHQGKVTGFTSCIAWFFTGPAQSGFGWLADRTQSYDIGLSVAGGLPIIAWFALLLFWPNDQSEVRRAD